MYFLSQPTDEDIQRFLSVQRQTSFSYPERGMTRVGESEHRRRSYVIDHNQIRLGEGEAVFRTAAAAVRAWQMFKLGWVDVFPSAVLISPGQTVAVRIRHLGFWSLNACRIVYTIEESRRFGFAYGTLEGHAERGEERFTAEWKPDNSVWFDILAFSRPRWLARLGTPVARSLQRQFARDAMHAIEQAVRTFGREM